LFSEPFATPIEFFLSLPNTSVDYEMSSTSKRSNGTGISRDDLQRHAYARSILGEDLFKKVATSKILVVGAGGIGCELLKNLVLVGFGDIEIVNIKIRNRQ